MAQTANNRVAARSIEDRAGRLAASLRVDVAGAQVRDWLAEENIDCVLIKGRAFAHRCTTAPGSGRTLTPTF